MMKTGRRGDGAREVRGPLPGRHVTALLLTILLVAAALRIPLLASAPPGLNQDEAINAWDAYCLLKTGTDSNGAPWPIFYARGFGSNRTTLFIYLLLPFQAIGGLGVWTARLPAALAGVAAVALMFAVGRRLYDPATGLVAAALLAVCPWHIQQSRWANEAGISTLLVLLPLAALLKAGFPVSDDRDAPPSMAWAGLAGILCGVCCYGYFAVRLFLPLFLIVIVVANWRSCRAVARTRAGAGAIAALALGVAVTFGPLLWMHIESSQEMNLRGRQTWVWSAADSPLVKVEKVLARYPRHFGPDFLFLRGDHYEFQAPPGGGQLRWFMLPLLVAGAIAAARRAGSSPAARVLLAWVITYPVGDLLSSSTDGYPHALRSLPGLGGLVLLAAVGCVAGWEWLRCRGRRPALAAAVLLSALALGETARFMWLFLGEYPRRPVVYHTFHVDLMAACRRLQPRLDGIDAVFCTTGTISMPYAMMLVGLGSSPERWFADQRRSYSEEGWDYHVQAGKLSFLYGRDWEPVYEQLLRNRRDDRVVFLVRPGELGLRDCPERIDGPPGTLPLLICERIL